jgi:hypothetical protein
MECDFNHNNTGQKKNMCLKVYHPYCLSYTVPDDQEWCCPRHFCDCCGTKDIYYMCRFCPISICKQCPGRFVAQYGLSSYADIPEPCGLDELGTTASKMYQQIICQSCISLNKRSVQRKELPGYMAVAESRIKKFIFDQSNNKSDTKIQKNGHVVNSSSNSKLNKSQGDNKKNAHSTSSANSDNTDDNVVSEEKHNFIDQLANFGRSLTTKLFAPLHPSSSDNNTDSIESKCEASDIQQRKGTGRKRNESAEAIYFKQFASTSSSRRSRSAKNALLELPTYGKHPSRPSKKARLAQTDTDTQSNINGKVSLQTIEDSTSEKLDRVNFENKTDSVKNNNTNMATTINENFDEVDKHKENGNHEHQYQHEYQDVDEKRDINDFHSSNDADIASDQGTVVCEDMDMCVIEKDCSVVNSDEDEEMKREIDTPSSNLHEIITTKTTTTTATATATTSRDIGMGRQISQEKTKTVHDEQPELPPIVAITTYLNAYSYDNASSVNLKSPWSRNKNLK